MLSIHSSPIGELGTEDTGGMSVYIRELSRELGSRGHKIDIYTRLSDKKLDQIIGLHENVRLIHLDIGNNGHISKLELHSYMGDFSCALEEFKGGENLQYDLIHSHYWLSGRLGIWAQERWNLPHTITFHTLGALKDIAETKEQKPNPRIVDEKKLARTCHRIVVATERERQHLISHYDASPDKIGVVPCGVNLDLFRPMDKGTARRQLGFDLKESIILYVGRFAPLKGIGRLLEAMIHLRHHQSLRLVIIGGDGHQAPTSLNLQNLAWELGIQDRVTFIGRLEQNALPPYYSAADVFVIPSYYESFGLVGLESLACGTPVVSTQVGAMESILQEGETGNVVSKPNPRLLANGIEAFISMPPSKRLSPNAIRMSVLKFDWSNVASAIVNEYSTLIRHQYGLGSGTPPVKTLFL
jgi:D-inositol-3-phosphate glycosyltransferase